MRCAIQLDIVYRVCIVCSMRMNISVPDSLRARMDRMSKKSEVNWSAIACRAFEEQVQQFERQRKTEVAMQDVIDRLKSEAAAESSEVSGQGAAAGADWAKRYAKPAQLKRLAKAAENSNEFGFIQDEMNANNPPAQQFAYYVSSAKDQEDSFILKDVASEIFGDDWAQLDAEYVDAFAHAAIEVWESVEPLL